nr:MAG TPA: hypothetical protein [Bacteriophage sp.]
MFSIFLGTAVRPSPVFPSNLPRTSVRGLRKTGRAGRSSECASDSFVPARFYLEILIFSYSLIILQRIHRARHPRGPRVLPFILLEFLLVRVFVKATVREDRAPFLFLSSDRDRRNDI